MKCMVNTFAFASEYNYTSLEHARTHWQSGRGANGRTHECNEHWAHIVMRQLHILALQLRTYYTLYTPSSGPRLMRFILIASRCVRALHRQCTNSMNKRRPKVESLVNGRSPPVAAQLFENINIYIICKLSWDLYCLQCVHAFADRWIDGGHRFIHTITKFN